MTVRAGTSYKQRSTQKNKQSYVGVPTQHHNSWTRKELYQFTGEINWLV